jgi:hypothetical protein
LKNEFDARGVKMIGLVRDRNHLRGAGQS